MSKNSRDIKSTSKDDLSKKIIAQPVLPDRPQGFEIGKLAKRKGIHQCGWGCEKFFSSLDQIADHPCPERQATYGKLVDMHLREGLEPPEIYVKEMNGDIDIGPACHDQDLPHYKEIIRGLGRSEEKDKQVAKWIETSEFEKWIPNVRL